MTEQLAPFQVVRNALLSPGYLKVVADAIPKGVNMDPLRLAWVTIVYCETPNDKGQTPLLDCSIDSLRRAMLQCAEVGLEPAMGGSCWILPRGRKANFQMGALGYVELALRAGAKRVWADVVYEADEFVMERGDSPVLKHGLTRSIALPGRNLDYDHKRLQKVENGGAGRAVCAYACLERDDGTIIWTVMPESDLQGARSASKAKDSPAYRNWPDQMRVRSAIARASKMWPRELKVNVSEESLANPALADRVALLTEPSTTKSLPEEKPASALDAIVASKKNPEPELPEPEPEPEPEELPPSSEPEPEPDYDELMR